jgi:hypothetical protein
VAVGEGDVLGVALVEGGLAALLGAEVAGAGVAADGVPVGGPGVTGTTAVGGAVCACGLGVAA